MLKSILTSIVILFSTTLVLSQGIIRGNVYDKETGDPILYTNIVLEGTEKGATTNLDGFFTISDVQSGSYTLMTTYLGYDTLRAKVTVSGKQIVYKSLYMNPSSVQLTTVQVSGRKEQARTEVMISTINVTPAQISVLPSTGGEADIAQYLQVIPGVVSTGSQGGQIYIRGGSPVQNKILIDGMTIYNPFHSIGFFSVFETEALKNVEVLTGGFDAEYGGRMSAVVDIKTREGSRTRFGGLVSGSPFQVKALAEGPIVPFKEGGKGSSSFLITAKQSILDQTSPSLYNYAIVDSIGSLPFKYRDIYGKVSFLSSNGSKANLFGFNFNDEVNYPGSASYQWEAVGGGMNFSLIPRSSNLVIGGTISYSNYDIGERVFNGDSSEPDPRDSRISNFGVNLDFSYFGDKSAIKYGLGVNGFTTDFSFLNPFGVLFSQQDNNTEINAWFKYKYKVGGLVIEPSIRLIYYASLGKTSPEPRIGLKYNITDRFRFKMAGGVYTQHLTSTVSERDIVNLFTGFITGDDLQKAYHAVAGVEIDIMEGMELNVEPYYKRFEKIIGLNRNRLDIQDPEFVSETGDAYGLDFLLKYDIENWYIWTTYSLGKVLRDNGEQEYPAIFDRRHNSNILVSYTFGSNKDWDIGARWNFGSGFRFTRILGFGERQDHSVVTNNPATDNGTLIPIYANELNQGTLPDYHRLDLTLKKRFVFTKYFKMEANFSVTNAYDRDNVLFINPLRADNKLFQLPILPSVGLKAEF